MIILVCASLYSVVVFARLDAVMLASGPSMVFLSSVESSLTYLDFDKL